MRIKIKTKPKKTLRDGTARYFLTVGTLAAYSAVSPAQKALAQQPAGTAGGAGQTPAQQTLVVHRFDIPAGPLDGALAAFQTATGWTVHVADPALLTIQSQGASGVFPAEQALRQLLTGTNVTYRITSAQNAILELTTIRESVDVADRVPLSSPRYTEPLRDLPQTISIITKEIIEQQGATSLADVLRNVPGLTMTAGEGGTPAGDNLTLRGNSVRNDIFVDGVRDLSPQSRDPFNLDQVEVTKGASPAVSGRGSAGGTVNLVSKGPSLMPLIGGSIALGNAETRRSTVDFSTPLSAVHMGERTGLRMNMLWHEGGMAGRDVVKNNRWGLAPTLGFGMGTPTRFTIGYYKLKQDNISDYGIPWVPVTNNALAAYRDQPAPVPRNTFYGIEDRDREILNQDTGTVKFEHDFSDSQHLRSQLRFGNSGRNSFATPPRFAGNDATTINRELRSWMATDRIWDNQTDLRSEFSTYGVRHSLVTGAAFTNERNIRVNRTGPNSPTTLLNPNPNDVYTGVITTSPFVGRITGNTQSLWAFDTAKFGQHLEATGGMRWDRFDVNGVSTTPAPVQQLVKMNSFRAGLIYKPVERGSIYAAYGSSMSPSLEGLSYSTANTSIPPEKTFTTEAGAKWEVGRTLLSGAIFQVAKDNARTPGILPTDPPQILAGRQVSRGVELSASGAITRSLRVLGAYTFINAKIRSSNNPLEVGKFFQNTPRNSASVWLTYTARRFSVGVGPRFMGQRYGNNINTRIAGGYATLDLMASYSVNKHMDLRFNITNLNNEYFFDRLGGGHLVPAAGRFGLLTANFHF